jgi:hypothetical protein
MAGYRKRDRGLHETVPHQAGTHPLIAGVNPDRQPAKHSNEREMLVRPSAQRPGAASAICFQHRATAGQAEAPFGVQRLHGLTQSHPG